MSVIRTIALVAVAGAVFATGAASRPANHVAGIAALFSETPFEGGQVPPRLYKWVNDDVSIFVQLDRSNPAEATTARYIGIGVKGTFCAEAQPGGPNGGFTHYHRVSAPVYAQGHGGQPGENRGYWLLWVATDTFESFDRRKVTPGVDYQFSPTPPPTCGANVPQPNFQAPGAHDLTRAEIKRLARFFSDNPFRGDQTPTRFYRWLSADVLAFLEFDTPNPNKAKALRYFGIATRGAFCSDQRPSADFTSFQRLTAPTWKKGRVARRAREASGISRSQSTGSGCRGARSRRASTASSPSPGHPRAKAAAMCRTSGSPRRRATRPSPSRLRRGSSRCRWGRRCAGRTMTTSSTR
jgi:hypothetical protein